MSTSLRIVPGVPRGIEGQVSRIKQCALELADAHESKNPVMALTDAAGLVMAVRDWLDKHHPSMTLPDLLTFGEAVRAAQWPVRESKTSVAAEIELPSFIRPEAR